VDWDLTEPVWEIAPRLLGAVLTHGEVSVRLVEVEAYDGANDPASHAYRGPSRRNSVMFGPPGHLYVYFTYGMHWAANVVCALEGTSSAVLLRGGEVVAGREVAAARRGRSPDRDLARGPARLTAALGLDGRHNGLGLFDGGEVSLRPGPVPDLIRTGPRVGVSAAAERAWRFWIAGDPHVSAYRAWKPRQRSRRGSVERSQ
jgi:DNA-3-methyladenine glycosylase